MSNYKLSNVAKEDLIEIHKFGVMRFGQNQADKYFNEFFDYFEKIANSPFSLEAVNQVRKGYRKCPCGSDTIYYRIIDDAVEIMSIIGRQDINNKLK